MLCTKTGLTFSNYHYVKVSWSSDKLPICPHCYQSPYDVDFDLIHKEIHQQDQLSTKSASQ
jgi:uncharacterized protein (DUF2225 family)